MIGAIDWASWGTAIGTLVLAAATFASIRSANRSARNAERALQIGLRPVTPSWKKRTGSSIWRCPSRTRSVFATR
jgi:hypothetical protein